MWYHQDMNSQISQIKQKILPVLRPYQVKKAGIFGSFVRGEDTPKSDIDILVEIGKKISLLDLVGLELKLEEKLGRKVDLVEYKTIKPALKKYILEEQLQIL